MGAAPTSFGKYFLTEKIATGGMAEIYLAKLMGPGGFEKQLIIKQIHPAFGERREFVELFVREAKTLVSLSHGNIVPVYELGVIEGVYFIAMEYIDGPTLAKLNESAQARALPISAAMAAHVCAELLKGLDYAHRKGAGVIHRDLSPRNVMLSRDGEVKLVDFGIAATVGDDLAANESSDGPPVGSFPYMSPEQVRREALDPRSDLFSAGVLFWELLTGRALFARDEPEATLEAVLSAEIAPPSSHHPEVSEQLDQICLRALARDREARFGTAGEFLARLTRYLYTIDPPITARQVSELVARACPPEVTRAASEVSGPATAALPDDVGDRTQPMPGRRAGRPAASTRTFATHIQFREVLRNATPLFPIDALPDDEASPEASGEPGGEPRGEAASQSPAEGSTTLAPSHRAGARTRAAFLAGGLALAGVAVVLFTQRAEQSGDRPTPIPTAIAARPSDAGPRPGPPDAGPSDASPPPDARNRRRRPRPDAAPRVRVTAMATLKVGAAPWGIAYLDGNKLGEVPGEFQVPAGPHKLRVVYPPTEESHPYSLDLRAGETEDLFVEFATP